MLKHQLNIVLEQLAGALEMISDAQYRSPINMLEGQSVGAHTRHIIELYRELEKGYPNGVVDYDRRERDQQIQTERIMALKTLQLIIASPALTNKSFVVLAPSMDPREEAQPIGSSYDREMMYQIEHAIHHLALIRVAFREIGIGPLPEDFGVAPSTLAYRQSRH